MVSLALALYLLPALLGTACLAAAGIRLDKITLLLVGTVIGTLATTTLIFLVAAALPLLPAAIIILLLSAAGIIFLLIRTDAWPRYRELPTDWHAVIIFLVTLVAFFPISTKLLIDHPDTGLSTGIINAYGDVAWHASNINLFAAGQSYPPENPIFAGTSLNYPFLPNFLSAVSVVLGSSLATSLTTPAVIFIPLFLTLFYSFTRTLTNSRPAAIVSVILFIFAGATFGFTRLPADFTAAETSLWDFLLHLPARDYSGVGTDVDGYHFLNPVTTLLLPQRNLLFGFPAALTILLLLVRPRSSLAHFLFAGLTGGLLPLFHAHSALAIAPFLLLLFIWQRDKRWLLFFTLAGLVGLPAIIYYLSNPSSHGAFLRWGPGWLAGEENYLGYWLKNTGFLLPITVFGLLWRRAPLLPRLAAGSGLVVFLAANLWLFAPWAWDNFKLLVYWLLLSLPLAACVLISMLRQRRLLSVLAVTVVLLQITSAAFDLWKIVLPTARVWTEWDNDAIAAGEMITTASQSDATILTAPIHNSPVALAGRPQYLGYAAHVWSHGGTPWPRENAIADFYAGRLQRLPETDPQYALIGPVERSQYSVAIPPTWQVVGLANAYTLYRLPPPVQNIP